MLDAELSEGDMTRKSLLGNIERSNLKNRFVSIEDDSDKKSFRSLGIDDEDQSEINILRNKLGSMIDDDDLEAENDIMEDDNVEVEIKETSQDEEKARKDANTYIANIKKMIEKPKITKDNIYKIIQDEMNKFGDQEDIFSVYKLAKLNYLVEEIHSKYDDDDIKLRYPLFYDQKFNEKIFKKYEFYKNKIGLVTQDNIEQKFNDYMSSKIFKLSNSQKFLKNYMSNQTPYRGLLIFHGVGVGKTCAAISIAEQFKDELLEMNKKIFVIRPQEIKNQIFDIKHVKSGKPEMQCTGTTYLDAINEPKAVEKCMAGEAEWCTHIENMVKKTTKKYYEFTGPLQWANKVNQEIKKVTRNIPQEYRKEREITKIRKMFSDSILIIDEAHNIKDKSDKDSHIIPPILRKVLGYSKNMRLILLSATPMFNSFTDLIPLVDYLLINDKRARIRERDIFDKDGDFVKGGREMLIEKTRGYISYLRGEDPIQFPLRFSSAINQDKNIISPDKWPSKDIYGITLKDKIKFLDIIGCPMSPLQFKIYNSYIEKRYKNNVVERTSAAFSAELQIGNIVFQPLSTITKDPKECYGDTGLMNIMDKVEGKSQYRFKEAENAEVFTMPTIKKYSSKIYEVINNIQKCDGLCFVYSQYESSGILPLAFALEMEGYTRFKFGHLPLLDYNQKKPSNGKQYVIISGKESLSKGFMDFVKKGPDMINDNVKIILGTKAASEGLNFHGVREIHILEPWHNLNRLEQVVGRGTRKYSHIRLPATQQNLTIYNYAITVPKNEEETVDMKIYRDAENKDIKIAEIELLMKQNAIDCNLNKNGNLYYEKYWNKDVEIHTSRGVKKFVKIHDKPYSRICHYQKNCDFKCLPSVDTVEEKDIDKTSYSLAFFENDIKEIMSHIVTIFTYDIAFTIDDIIDYVRQKMDFLDINALYKALDNLVKNKTNFKDNIGRFGYIVFQGNYYLFQPNSLNYEKLIYEHRRLPLTVKTNVVDLGNYVQKLKGERMELLKKDQYNYDDIVEKVAQNVRFTMEHDVQSKFFTTLEISKSEAYSIVLDRLVYQYKNVLLKFLLKKMIGGEKLSDVEKDIVPGLAANIIRFQDVFDVNNNNIYGYKLIYNGDQIFYVYNQNTNDFDQDQGNRNRILERQADNIKTFPKDNEVLGYLKFDKRDSTPSFKIRDVQNKTDDTHNIKGTNCIYKGKNEIFKYIKLLSDKAELMEEQQKGHKNYMCNDIEVLLRRLQNKQGHKKTWFLNAEKYMETHHEVEA